MTAPTDIEFVSGTTITSEWLNGVNDKLKETISVRDFGAIIDGVADDSTAAQDALVANRSVMYNAGTLKLTSIALPTTLTLTGESKYLTTIKRTANANTVSIIAADSSEISNISINNDKATNGFDGHGIAGTQPKTTIKDVSISDFGSTSGGGGAGVCLFHSATNPKLMRLSNSEMSGRDRKSVV